MPLATAKSPIGTTTSVRCKGDGCTGNAISVAGSRKTGLGVVGYISILPVLSDGQGVIGGHNARSD